MSAISGTRRALKELVDGTIRVQIDIDPDFKKQFLELFPTIDMPIALAPLNPDFEKQSQAEKPKGGPLCQLAARWCKDQVFLDWLGEKAEEKATEEEAAAFIRHVCGISSRAELDNNPEAADRFNAHFRTPYMDFLKSTLKDLNV